MLEWDFIWVLPGNEYCASHIVSAKEHVKLHYSVKTVPVDVTRAEEQPKVYGVVPHPQGVLDSVQVWSPQRYVTEHYALCRGAINCKHATFARSICLTRDR